MPHIELSQLVSCNNIAREEKSLAALKKLGRVVFLIKS